MTLEEYEEEVKRVAKEIQDLAVGLPLRKTKPGFVENTLGLDIELCFNYG